MSTPLGADARVYAPIPETNFQDQAYNDQVTALRNEGMRRLSESQDGKEAVAEALAKALPEGLDWQNWRRSTNVEASRSVYMGGEAADLGISPSLLADLPIVTDVLPRPKPKK